MFERILRKNAALLTRFYDHPFNVRLGLGTLPRHNFEFFLKQDAFYLPSLSEALQRTAKRLNEQNNPHATHFEWISQKMIRLEQKIHTKYLANSPRNSFFSENQKMRPDQEIAVISRYKNHLIENASNAPIPVSVASYLACLYPYNQQGGLYQSFPESHPYRDWLNSYSGEDYTAYTKTTIAIFNELTKEITCPTLEEQICAGFTKSANYELEFLTEALAVKSDNCKNTNASNEDCIEWENALNHRAQP